MGRTFCYFSTALHNIVYHKISTGKWYTMNLINRDSRKPFSQADYDKYNTMAFQLLKEDLPDFYVDQPKENYGIDTFVYPSEHLFKAGADPLFAVELEVKRSGGWGTGEYPYPTIHFLARKAKNRVQDCIPFFVQYNQDGSNALVIPYPHIFSYPLKQMHSAKTDDGVNLMTSDDYYYDIGKEACTFGRKNLQQAVIDYYAKLLQVSQNAVTALPESMMTRANKIYTAMIGLKAA